MTSTITRMYVEGETPDEYTYTTDQTAWCSEGVHGFFCSIRRGHEGPQHVAANEYRIVAVKDREEPLAAWKREVRDLAHTIVTSRGYGNFAVWNDTLIRIGLEPFTEKQVRVVAPATRVLVDLGSRYDEERAREWLAARRHNLAGYLRPQDDEIGEPTVEVTEDTPREDDSVEKDPRADTDDLDEYKAFVREVAIEMGTAQSWCDDGVNGVLGELGLRRKVDQYDVRVQLVAYQTVTIRVDAANEDDARRQVNRYGIRDEIDSSEWEWNGDWESDDVEVEEV